MNFEKTRKIQNREQQSENAVHHNELQNHFQNLKTIFKTSKLNSKLQNEIQNLKIKFHFEVY